MVISVKKQKIFNQVNRKVILNFFRNSEKLNISEFSKNIDHINYQNFTNNEINYPEAY